MKKILLVIVFLVAVIVIAPFFIGSSAENQVRGEIAKVNSHTSYEINLIEYDKGWFSSTAVIELSILLPEDIPRINSLNKIKITQDIQHGPVLWQGSGFGIGLMDAKINFELPEGVYKEIDKKVLFLTSRTTFGLITNLHLNLLKFTIKQDSTLINIKEGYADIQYDMSGHIAGDLIWQGMNINTNDQEIFNLDQLTINTEQTLVSGEIFDPAALFVGFFKSNIAQLQVNGETVNENLSARDLSFNITSNIKEDLANVAVIFTINNLQAINQQFNHLSYDMTLQNLDVESLKAMNQIAAANKAQGHQNQDPLQLAAKFQSLLPKLIEKQPVFKINQLGMKTKNGDINADLTISIDNSIYDINNPMSMILAIVADAKGQMPEAFFDELGMTDSVEMMLQQNFLIRDQQNLKFEFTFNNGQALLNGKPMPLAGM